MSQECARETAETFALSVSAFTPASLRCWFRRLSRYCSACVSWLVMAQPLLVLLEPPLEPAARVAVAAAVGRGVLVAVGTGVAADARMLVFAAFPRLWGVC